MELLGLKLLLWLSWWLRQWRIHRQCRRPGFDPWVKKIPWQREWQPTPAFLPGEFHERKSPAGYSPWDSSQTWLSNWPCIQAAFMYIWAKTKSACRLITENGTNTTSMMWPRQNQALIHISLHQSISLYYFSPLSLCFSWHRRNSCDTSRISHLALILESCIFPFGEGNGNPLQYSCLENPRAAIYGVARSQTWLKWLSSSSSRSIFLFLYFPCPNLNYPR